MKQFHPSVTPCEQWGKPHECYRCACAKHAERQKINEIAMALEKDGIPCTVDQTGGFCMVVHVYAEDEERWLGVTQEGVCFFEHAEDDGVFCDSDLPKDQIVKIVKENLWRIGRGQR